MSDEIYLVVSESFEDFVRDFESGKLGDDVDVLFTNSNGESIPIKFNTDYGKNKKRG